jgi:hypothetical protein
MLPVTVSNRHKGGANMATKSITKAIEIKTKAQCRALVRALEGSKVNARTVTISKTHSELSREQIREIFKEH